MSGCPSLRQTLGTLALASWAFNLSGAELDGAALVEEKRCIACHHETEPLLGPPYIAIAARHAAQAEVMAEAMVEVLAQKIISGGAGNWGLVPMVPNEHVSRDEARAMARWILGLNPPSEARASRKAYFGDLHLHTSNSYDAAWGGTRTTREDTYR